MPRRKGRAFSETLIVGMLLAMVCYCSRDHSPPEAVPGRIISLSPGITESLFALGLGDRVAGVTTYCTFPQQAGEIEKVGGYADANCEKIVYMRPDLVVLSYEHEKQRIYLERFNVRTLKVNYSTCASVCSSIVRIGRATGTGTAADSLIGLFRTRFTRSGQPRDDTPPTILFCIGRDSPGIGEVKRVYVAGRNTFYNELIEANGAINAFPDSFPAYPELSPEGILSLAPEIIIDIAPAMGNRPCSLLVRDWEKMTRVPAVVKGQVYCLSQTYAIVPGPRLVLLYDDIRRIVEAVDARRHE